MEFVRQTEQPVTEDGLGDAERNDEEEGKHPPRLLERPAEEAEHAENGQGNIGPYLDLDKDIRIVETMAAVDEFLERQKDIDKKKRRGHHQHRLERPRPVIALQTEHDREEKERNGDDGVDDSKPASPYELLRCHVVSPQ